MQSGLLGSWVLEDMEAQAVRPVCPWHFLHPSMPLTRHELIQIDLRLLSISPEGHSSFRSSVDLDPTRKTGVPPPPSPRSNCGPQRQGLRSPSLVIYTWSGPATQLRTNKTDRCSWPEKHRQGRSGFFLQIILPRNGTQMLQKVKPVERLGTKVLKFLIQFLGSAQFSI